MLDCSEFHHEGTELAAFWAIKHCQYKLNVHLAVDWIGDGCSGVHHAGAWHRETKGLNTLQL